MEACNVSGGGLVSAKGGPSRGGSGAGGGGRVSIRAAHVSSLLVLTSSGGASSTGFSCSGSDGSIFVSSIFSNPLSCIVSRHDLFQWFVSGGLIPEVMSVSFQVPIFTRDDVLAAETGVAWGQLQHPIVFNYSNICRDSFRRDLVYSFVFQDHRVPIGSSTFVDVEHNVLFPERAKLVFMNAPAWNPLCTMSMTTRTVLTTSSTKPSLTTTSSSTPLPTTTSSSTTAQNTTSSTTPAPTTTFSTTPTTTAPQTTPDGGWCPDGFSGVGCRACEEDTYSGGCDKQCDEDTSCSGNGRCRGSDGTCICDKGWTGAHCADPDEPSQQCSDGFSGVGCQACDEDNYSGGCEETCDADVNCRGSGIRMSSSICNNLSSIS